MTRREKPKLGSVSSTQAAFAPVTVSRSKQVYPTYMPGQPDPHPMYLENRVYQGSSGNVYPLPVIDSVANDPVDREWDTIVIENGLVSLTILPEIGGRIHVGRDLTNEYDFFYRQDVIKPALVGLAGPWISGGVEFNWPQHHRPSTFMPCETCIEESEDGSVTVWLSEHEPMNRMKGMHGVCLRPSSSLVELKVRLHNRTPFVQTFLWWANAAVHVHEFYQSVFPRDVAQVADHAKRAMSSFPLCEGSYYGVDYGGRAASGVPETDHPRYFDPRSAAREGVRYAPNDLSWYANIPVPTSYMCVDSAASHFGGYDHRVKAGLVHFADRQISPGKKQWTWGNHEFGYAWDRHLTDVNGPYVELMAGVFTDNQPDFSFLAPGETRTFSQFWYPISQIGPPIWADRDLAIGLTEGTLGIGATRELCNLSLVIEEGSEQRILTVPSVEPETPFLVQIDAASLCRVRVEDADGKALASVDLKAPPARCETKQAVEPLAPVEIKSCDELFLTGLHLWQYRHATRRPAPYWEEALKRDSGDVRCNTAMGMLYLRQGESERAEVYLRRAVDRLTALNPNPDDGEAHYLLGLALRYQERREEAKDVLAKAAWNAAWAASAHYELAKIEASDGNYDRASHHCQACLRMNAGHSGAAHVRALCLTEQGDHADAERILRELVRDDPLDFQARYLLGDAIHPDNNVLIDLAFDWIGCGAFGRALEVLSLADRAATDGTAPMIGYISAYSQAQLGAWDFAETELAAAQARPPELCFPSRLEEEPVLRFALERNPLDCRAAFFLGNMLYDKERHREAIELWEMAVRHEPTNAIALRNLGIASYNVSGDAELARSYYEAALCAHTNPAARLVYEFDQLLKRIGATPSDRLARLTQNPDQVHARDDLTIEYCSLLSSLGRHQEARDCLESRQFHPWEGGEGLVLGAYTRAVIGCAAKLQLNGESIRAKGTLLTAVNPPDRLGEKRHLLANASDLWLALGDACADLGDYEEASNWWQRAADFKGDFQNRRVTAFSDQTWFSIAALRRLNREAEANQLTKALENFAIRLEGSSAKVDYFATSLPTMILFNDDLDRRQRIHAWFLQAQAKEASGDLACAHELVIRVLSEDPNHERALDFRQMCGEK